MTLDTSSIEKSLLKGKWTALAENNTHPIAQIAQSVLQGNFREVLLSPAARQIFQIDSPTLDRPLDEAFRFPTEHEQEQEQDELLRLIYAIASFHAFIQANWTGPDLDVHPTQLFPISSPPSPPSADILNQKAISELSLGGEPAYHLTQDAAFLRFAQILLALPYTSSKSAPWWRLRVALVHQQILDDPVPLPESLFTSLGSLAPLYSGDPVLSARLQLERGLLEHLFSHGKSAGEFFVQAANATGLQYELTGALGKRTKFQQFELSQLVLLAESRLADDDNIPNPSLKNKLNFPETLPLNDDTLLEQTTFTSSHHTSPTSSLLTHIDPSSQPPLHPLDQSILLSMCLNVKNTSPTHGLTNEQMSPYIARVISHPLNWSIHTMALLLRSRLQSTRSRTVELSTLQLQALIDQMPTTTADSNSNSSSSSATVEERLKYFHALPLPTKWDLQRELATRFLSLGATKSALEIFERLEMWEEVVKCWGALERSDVAIGIVRDLLEGRKAEAEEVTARGKKRAVDADEDDGGDERRRGVHDAAREAKFWCLLGDLEPARAEEHYERAWRVSRGTSGRAMRSLGGYYFSRERYEEAIVSLKRAVAINPLLVRSWFILGCACMRVEEWEEAKNAFGRCVAIDEDDAESWNNLASMYLRMGTTTTEGEDNHVPFSNKLLAFRALKQGLRFSYDNWRMWHNYMVVAIDVGELSEACRALGRVVEETGGKLGVKSVDEDVLERLVDAVMRRDSSTAAAAAAGDVPLNPNEGQGLLRNVMSLLEETVLPRAGTMSPRIFRAYARMLTLQSRWGDAVKAYLDGYRCGVAGTMEKGEPDVEKWREAVGEVEEIVDVLINFGPRVEEEEGGGEEIKWRFQGRSIVRTFMAKTKDFEDEVEWERLVQLDNDLRKEIR